MTAHTALTIGSATLCDQQQRNGKHQRCRKVVCAFTAKSSILIHFCCCRRTPPANKPASFVGIDTSFCLKTATLLILHQRRSPILHETHITSHMCNKPSKTYHPLSSSDHGSSKNLRTCPSRAQGHPETLTHSCRCLPL